MGHFSFLLGLGACMILFCPPRLESVFPPVLWKSCSQVPLAFKVIFPRDSQSLYWIPRLGSLTQGLEPLQQWENFLVLLFSSLWITHSAGMGFDLNMFVPLLPSWCGFFFVFGHGISFFLVGSSVVLLVVVQKVVAILVLLQEEMSAHPSTLPS